jgi:F0F1-type ATP synthase membrane subunit b/b'
MSTTFIISLAAFVVCLILLFYFIAKYREAEVTDNDEELDLSDEEMQIPYAAQDGLRFFGKGSGVSAKEIADIKDKLKDLHYRVEEIKLLEEKRNGELTKLVARVEQRVTTFENEYVNKLQPTLHSLINELENIQTKTKN